MAADKATARVAALMKKGANRSCFDCQAPGASTQAVLAPYGVFVCVTCGGIHREMQHRVKGVSMSTFKDEEADFLEQHGNKRGAAAWLAHYDASKHAPLDKIAGIAEKIRPFIHMVFEDKAFHAENPANRNKPRAAEAEAGAAASGAAAPAPAAAARPQGFGGGSRPGAVPIDDDPFGFSPSPSPFPAPAPAPHPAPAPAPVLHAPSATGRLSAAPPSAAPGRLRARAGTGTQQVPAAHGTFDSFDAYYGMSTGGGGVSGSVSGSGSGSSSSSSSSLDFDFGGATAAPTTAAPLAGAAMTTTTRQAGAGPSTDPFSSFGAASASAPAKHASVADILGGLGDLYASGPPIRAGMPAVTPPHLPLQQPLDPFATSPVPPVPQPQPQPFGFAFDGGRQATAPSPFSASPFDAAPVAQFQQLSLQPAVHPAVASAAAVSASAFSFVSAEAFVPVARQPARAEAPNPFASPLPAAQQPKAANPFDLF